MGITGDIYNKAVVYSTNRNAFLDIISVNILDVYISREKHVRSSRFRRSITLDELRDKIKSGIILGFSLDDRGNILSSGKLIDYPYITYSKELKNNIPVVIFENDDMLTLISGVGKIIEIKRGLAYQRFSKFANAVKQNNTVEVLKEQVNLNLGNSVLLDSILNFKSDNTLIDKTGTGKEKLLNAILENRRLSASDLAQYFTERAFETGETSTITNNNIQENSYREIDDAQGFDGDSGQGFEIVEVDDRVELRAYSGESFIDEIKIPEGVTHICDSVFIGTDAKRLYIPESTIYLGENAFKNSKFEEIHLSSHITAIPYMCFAYTKKLKKLNLDNISSIDNMAFFSSEIEEAVIEAPLIQVGIEAFKGCKSLKVFKHKGTLKKIRRNAFYGCISLEDFDFSSVTTIEQGAFYNTGIKKAVINGDVNYLQTGTFTGKITEIELLDGMYKISSDAVSNIDNESIKWTLPLSVKNIEKGVFKEKDVVCCYRKSVAASSAILADAQLVYLDGIENNNIPAVIKKAQLLDASVEEILHNTLQGLISKEEMDCEYLFNEDPVIKGDIPDEVFEVLNNQHKYGEYASESDIKYEKAKFKCILEHLHKVARFDITPFSSAILLLKDTFNCGMVDDEKSDKSTIQVLYSDGISEVLRIKYIDNKFESINSSFILAKTKDTLRYICMDNKYTDILCENSGSYNMDKLINILRPGDTIGLNSIIQGVKYPSISAKSSKEIVIKRNNKKVVSKLEMNMYQALRYSSITIKLDNNNIALLIPGNRTIIKCASLGKTVWLNEKEDTYKSLQCTIESIEDIDHNTVFDYESTYNHLSYGALFKRFKAMEKHQYKSYIESYSHIYKAEQSMYKHAGEYAYSHEMNSISDVDLGFMMILFKTSLFEERRGEWLEGSVGKTIVPDAKLEFPLSDGATLYQYRSVKRIALRNKLMSGGDRKLYIFEIIDSYNVRIGVYISLYDIETLVNMCISVNKANNNEMIFINKESFDVIDGDNIVEIASMCKGNMLHVNNIKGEFILAVYKPNGIYYIGLKIAYGKSFKFIPIIQIGELDVALEFIEETNKFGINNASMLYLYKGSLKILANYIENTLGIKCNIKYSAQKYLGLLKARELCISGVSDIQSYNNIGIAEVLKRCLGYSSKQDDVNTEEFDDSIDDELNNGYI